MHDAETFLRRRPLSLEIMCQFLVDRLFKILLEIRRIKPMMSKLLQVVL